MTDRLIDNQDLRLSDALSELIPHATVARFAVGYFFISGFNALADKIGKLDKLQLLIGTTSSKETIEQLALGYRRRELIEEKLREQRFVAVERAIGETVTSIRQEISELQPGEREEKTIATLAELITSGKIEVKVYTRGTLHAKAYIFDYRHPQPNSKGIGIVGSSNLTEPGLTVNSELNVQVDDDANVMTGEGLHRDLCTWFDRLWADAKPFSTELMNELKESWALTVARPYDVYLKMLFELVRSRLEGDGSKLILPEEIPLAAYQKVAVQQAIRMVDQYGGAFVADVVGVGKTFVGSAVARFYYESEKRRPLIICPNALVEMWEKYSKMWFLNAEIVSMSMLREQSAEGADRKISGLDEELVQHCGFVLIDESHNFRYSDSQRYRVLSDFLMEGTDRKVLLLTATPYNKSALDIYNQLKLFHHNETTMIPVEPRNLKQYFKRVEDGERRLSDLLVHMLVRRTRWQLLRWYGYDENTDKAVDTHNFQPYLNSEKRAYLRFYDAAGTLSKKFFPLRELETIDYCIDDVYGNLFGKSLYDQIVALLHRRKTSISEETLEDEPAPASDPRALTYARYGLWNYVKPEWKNDARYKRLVRAGKNLRGLIRTSLFKRLESSVEAFRKSIGRQVTVHENFLAALSNGKIAAGERAADLLEIDRDDTEEALQSFLNALEEFEEQRGFHYDIDAFEKEHLRADVEHDLDTFRDINEMVSTAKIPASNDDKLKTLMKQLLKLRQKGKVILFTQYEDTAKYLMDNLPTALRSHAALVTGETENKMSVVRRFAPEANEYAPGRGQELHLLIATDVLSEGLNLQDCHQVVNYDLHWNPVRLIQRFGRIDRVGSNHDRIFAFNFLPEKAAEHELGLSEKLRARISEFNEILGLDSQVLDNKEKVNTEAVYAVYEEKGGRHLGAFEAGETDLVGVTLAEAEEFFRDLREKAPAEYDRIKNLRDGIRTARSTGEKKVLVLCRAGDFLHLYVRNLDDQSVDIDTLDALNLLKCGPEELPAELPRNLNGILTTVKLKLTNDVDELWKQSRTKSPLSPGQKYVRDGLERLRVQLPHLDADGGLSRLAEATVKTRQRRFQRACDRLRRDKVAGEALLRRTRQLYYDCALHIEVAAVKEEEIETRIPRIVAVAALV
ncbi:MAG: helicase-related protein [Dehalococcoidia bacterium]|nr:helicase-related protein [Dehalococcoidia bacterium]